MNPIFSTMAMATFVFISAQSPLSAMAKSRQTTASDPASRSSKCLGDKGPVAMVVASGMPTAGAPGADEALLNQHLLEVANKKGIRIALVDPDRRINTQQRYWDYMTPQKNLDYLRSAAASNCGVQQGNLPEKLILGGFSNGAALATKISALPCGQTEGFSEYLIVGSPISNPIGAKDSCGRNLNIFAPHSTPGLSKLERWLPAADSLTSESRSLQRTQHTQNSGKIGNRGRN